MFLRKSVNERIRDSSMENLLFPDNNSIVAKLCLRKFAMLNRLFSILTTMILLDTLNF